MSAPVDVLAVLRSLNLADPGQRAGLNQAIAAAAELAEASSYVCQRTNGEVNGYTRLSAALAGFKGGAA